MPTLLRTGLLAVALLALSRVSGVLRESSLAAALGVGATADAVVLMLTLPDMVVGVLLGGVLSYVLLPQWARLSPAAKHKQRARQWRAVMGLGLVCGAAVWVGRDELMAWLAPALALGAPVLADAAATWAALALPLAVWAAWGGTRLQHRSDLLGLYTANLAVNATLIFGLLTLAWVGLPHGSAAWALHAMGACLLLAMVARLLWQRWRLRIPSQASPAPAVSAPAPTAAPESVARAWPLWTGALMCAGMPLAAYLLSRSLASAQGPGSLTQFNLAWKLVELPQVLLIQVVAMLALPRLSRAAAQVGRAGDAPAWLPALRQTLALALALACAATVGLHWSGQAAAALLYGWGAMPVSALAELAAWAQRGAWSLPAQALAAMLVALLAAQQKLAAAAAAWTLAALPAAVVVGLSPAAWQHGAAAMAWLAGLWWAAALALLATVAWTSRVHAGWWRALLHDAWAPLLLTGLSAAVAWGWDPALRQDAGALGWAAGLAGAAMVLSVAWWCSPGLRDALRR